MSSQSLLVQITKNYNSQDPQVSPLRKKQLQREKARKGEGREDGKEERSGPTIQSFRVLKFRNEMIIQQETEKQLSAK